MEERFTGEFKQLKQLHPTKVYLLDPTNDVPTSSINQILSGLSKSNDGY